MAERINFYRTDLDRDLLKSLTQRRNLPGFLQSMGILLFYLLTTALCLYLFMEKSWVLMIAACYLHSIFTSFLGMEASVHELSHKTPFKTKWLNEIFYGLFAFLTWNNPVHFRASHTNHHQLTMFRGRDKEVIIEPGAVGINDYISWFLFDWKHFLRVMPPNFAFAFGRDKPDVFFWDPLFGKDDPRRKKMFVWARFQIIGHIILIAVFAYFKLYVLIYTVSFSYFFATFLGMFTGMVQHQGMKSNIPDWRMICHTMIFGPVISFFYWRMNYHIEHHMYAAVPFYNLHKLHKAMAHDTPDPVRGFIPGVRKIMGLLKKQRKEGEWYYTPEFPPTANPPRLKEE